MAIEEIDPKTGEVTTRAEPQDEIAVLMAKLAEAQAAKEAADKVAQTSVQTPVQPIAD